MWAGEIPSCQQPVIAACCAAASMAVEGPVPVHPSPQRENAAGKLPALLPAPDTQLFGQHPLFQESCAAVKQSRKQICKTLLLVLMSIGLAFKNVVF